METENTTKVHHLKIVQPFFNQVKKRQKRFELRKNDRGFKPGDFIMLEEFDLEKKSHSGQKVIVLIEQIWQEEVKFGLKQDYCIIGIKFREEFDEYDNEKLKELLDSMF